MIGHRAVESQAAEPAIRQVEMHLLTQPALGTDAERVTDNQHPDHQLGVDRGSPRLTVVRPQMIADVRQINETVDRAQQVARRDMILEAEAVKQRLLHHRPLTHHQPVSPASPEALNQSVKTTSSGSFSTQSTHCGHSTI